MIHFSEVMDQYWYITIINKQSPYFIQMSMVLPDVHFLFQDSIHDIFSCYIFLDSSWLWLFFSQIFMVIDDLDSFEESWLGILQSISQLRFVQCVSHD